MIKVTDIHKTYDDGKVQVHALRGVDVEIKEGEDPIMKILYAGEPMALKT